MKIRIEPYREEMVEAAMLFNERLNSAGTGYSTRLPETCLPAVLSKTKGSGFCQECFLALEGTTVRGGYILYRQLWTIRGETVAVANCMRPISEGVIDATYGIVGPQLIYDALRRQPLLFGLGLGDTPMTQMLKIMGWEIWPVPLYFKVVNGTRFLKNLPALRNTPAVAVLMDLAAASGLGSIGVKVASALTSRKAHRLFSVETVDCFSSWSDQLWDACKRMYSVLETRDADVLNRLFSGRPEFTCLKVSEGARPLGWAVLESIASNQIRFGSMKVESIMDCLAAPQHADAVIQTATEYLENRDVDLIISNQSHPVWRKALRRSGFLKGPSSFLFASVSPLTKLLHAADPLRNGMHFNRGGGDVPLQWQTDTSMPDQLASG